VGWNSSETAQSAGGVKRQITDTRKTSPGAVSVGTIDELHALGYLGSADARSATDVPEPWLLPDPRTRLRSRICCNTAMMASENGEPNKARVALERVLQLDESSAIAL